MSDKYGRIATFDPALGGGKGGLRVAPDHDRYQSGIDTFRTLYPGLIIETGDFMKGDLNNLAPRLGFAYTPLGNSNIVVRGGYGVFYQVQNLISSTNITSPFVLSQRFTTTDNITFTNPWGSGVAQGATISAQGFTYDERTPYYQNWNLGIQRELPGSFLLDVSYQGKKGTHLLRSRDINQPSLSFLQHCQPAGIVGKFELSRPASPLGASIWKGAVLYFQLRLEQTDRRHGHAA
jgi:hypothetical protein